MKVYATKTVDGRTSQIDADLIRPKDGDKINAKEIFAVAADRDTDQVPLYYNKHGKKVYPPRAPAISVNA